MAADKEDATHTMEDEDEDEGDEDKAVEDEERAGCDIEEVEQKFLENTSCLYYYVDHVVDFDFGGG